MVTDELKKLEKEILSEIQQCFKCRMCVGICPTYEGWYTESALGRLMAINLHFKYGLGSEEELSNLLFTCTTCGRCKVMCKTLSKAVDSTDTFIKARNLLVKRAQDRGKKIS